MKNKKYKNFIKTLMIIILTLSMFTPMKKVFADEISFAVSPSKIVDVRIEPGESKDIIFSIGNRSVFPKEHTDKNELYKFSVETKYSLVDSEGFEVLGYEDANLITFDRTLVEIKPNEADKITATINIPEDFEKNYYTLYIDFTRLPIKGIEDTGSVSISSIKVPIMIFVGNEDEFSKLKSDYEITDYYMDFGQDGKGFIGRTLENLKNVISINPLKTVDAFKDILYRPVNNITAKNKLIVDINDDSSSTEATSVLKNSGNPTNWKYIIATKEQLGQPISSVQFEKNEVKFLLKSEEVVTISGTISTISSVKTQLNNITQNLTGTVTLNDLLSKIKVPINKDYEMVKYNLVIKAKNTGEKDIHLTSENNLIKDNSTAVGVGAFRDFTIGINKEETIKVNLETQNASVTGNYNVEGKFLARNIGKQASYSYEVDSILSLKLFIATLIVYVLILALIAYVVYRIIIMLIKHKYGFVKKNGLEGLSEEELNEIKTELSKDKLMKVAVEELVVRKSKSVNSKMIDTLEKGFVVEICDDIKEESEWVKIKYTIKR